ncbi:MAG: SPW repeat domain-containing protein [bacterium]
MWAAWVNGILGIWLIIAAFIRSNPTFGLWDNLIVGILVAVFALLYIGRSRWQGWLSLIFGLWIIISGLIPQLRSGNAYLWSNLIAGILIATGGFVAVYW